LETNNRRLSDEIQNIYQNVSLTVTERELYDKAIEELQTTCSEVDSSCKMFVIGSYAMDVAMRGSDVDIFVRTVQGSFLKNMHTALCKKPFVKNSTVIKANIPVCRFRTKTGIQFDINIQDDGTGAVGVMQEYFTQYPVIRPLCVAFKLLVKKQGLSTTRTGGLPSLGLLFMLVSHIQHYATNFTNNPTLGSLFIDFLFLYSQFDFDHNTICVRTSSYIPKKEKNMYIRDPTDDSRDIISGSSSITLIRKKFELIGIQLMKNMELKEDHFLLEIITDDCEKLEQ
jgi:DNA polymerase sigma